MKNTSVKYRRLFNGCVLAYYADRMISLVHPIQFGKLGAEIHGHLCNEEIQMNCLQLMGIDKICMPMTWLTLSDISRLLFRYFCNMHIYGQHTANRWCCEKRFITNCSGELPARCDQANTLAQRADSFHAVLAWYSRPAKCQCCILATVAVVVYWDLWVSPHFDTYTWVHINKSKFHDIDALHLVDF